MADCSNSGINDRPQASFATLVEAPRNVVFGSVEPFDPESYHGIRDDLDTLMGDLESAVGLVCFLVMRETESTEGSPMALSPDFVGALFSVQNLLEGFKRRGDTLVSRMMDLERIAEAQP